MPLIRIGAVLGLLVACDSTGDTSDTANAPTTTIPCDVEPLAGSPALELGTGEDVWTPVVDGDDVIIVFGPQGGYHLDGSIRVTGIEAGGALGDPNNPLTTFRVLDEKGEIVSGVGDQTDIEYLQGIEESCLAGTHEMIGRRIFLDIQSDRELDGQLVTVEVEVEDVNGVTLTDSRQLRAVPSPFN